MGMSVRITRGAALAAMAACALALSGCGGPSAISRGETLFSPLKQKASAPAMGGELWKTPLRGTGIVEGLSRLPDGRLLVSLRQYGFTMPIRECLLVDGADGKVLWTHDRGDFPGAWRLLVGLPDRIVFQVDGREHASVVVLDAATGVTRWTRECPPGSLVRPLSGAGILVTFEPEKGSTLLTGFDLADGARRWTREIPVALASAPAPLLLPEGLVHFLGGAERVKASTGEAEWKRGKIAPGPGAAPPAFAADGVWVVAGANELVLFDPVSGNQLSAAPLPSGVRVTNVYPLGKRVILRGVEKGESLTIEVDAGSGKPLWTFRDAEPSISNLLDIGGTLFFATPTSLVALDRQGRRLFKAKVTELGQDFPVSVRRAGDAVVFIGEMVVAGFEAATGRQLWWNGIDPIHQDADTDALNKGIDRAESNAAAVGGGVRWAPSGDQARQYQAQADADFRLWETGRSDNSTYGPGIGGRAAAYQRSRINSAFAKAQAQIDFQFAMMDLGKQLEEGARRFIAEERGDYYRFIQRGIFQAYPFAETKGYVLRPSRKGDLVGVTAIQLATGRRQFTPYGPQHELFGLWNLPDEGRGVVIHEALRPDPAVPADERGYRPFVNYLMATPVAWPK